jgi:hypothetical protein
LAGKEEAIAADYAREKEQLYQTEHFLDSDSLRERYADRHKRRYAGDVTWNARKREARRFIGLHKFLDVETWHNPGDFKSLKLKASKFAFNFFDAIAFAQRAGGNLDPTNPNLSVTQFYEALVEQLGLEIEKSEWKTELVFDGQGKAVLNKDGTQKRKKYKLRRICSESWKLFELFCEHRQKQVASSKSQVASDDVPTTPENLYKNGGGWNISQSHTRQEIEGSFLSQKTETNSTAILKMDESLTGTNTQTKEQDNDVPATPQINSQLIIRNSQLPDNCELRIANCELLQGCLKELRQVSTADDYWVLYEQSSQLVEEAWKRLNPPEQLRIQQICDEGIDPLEQWLEGDRCWLWHPFAQEKWGLATVKQVVRGACGFIYVLRDDGFGLHLGRDRLNLIASISGESTII